MTTRLIDERIGSAALVVGGALVAFAAWRWRKLSRLDRPTAATGALGFLLLGYGAATITRKPDLDQIDFTDDKACKTYYDACTKTLNKALVIQGWWAHQERGVRFFDTFGYEAPGSGLRKQLSDLIVESLPAVKQIFDAMQSGKLSVFVPRRRYKTSFDPQKAYAWLDQVTHWRGKERVKRYLSGLVVAHEQNASAIVPYAQLIQQHWAESGTDLQAKWIRSDLLGCWLRQNPVRSVEDWRALSQEFTEWEFKALSIPRRTELEVNLWELAEDLAMLDPPDKKLIKWAKDTSEAMKMLPRKKGLLPIL